MFVTRSCHGRPQADAEDAHASTKFTDILFVFLKKKLFIVPVMANVM